MAHQVRSLCSTVLRVLVLSALVSALEASASAFPIRLSAEDPQGGDPFAEIDSLLVRGDPAMAGDVLEGLPRRLAARGVPEESYQAELREYHTTIELLKANVVLPDSVAGAYCENIERFRDLFDPFNAGQVAAASFEQALGLRDAGSCATAYERYLLARFFLGRHMRKEQERLRANLESLRSAMRDHEYDEATALVDRYQHEDRTQAFLSFKDTLDRAYSFIELDLNEALAKREFERQRVQIAPCLELTVGVSLVPGLSIAYKQLPFIDPGSGQPNVVPLDDEAADLPVTTFSGELNVYVTPAFSIGVAASTSLRAEGFGSVRGGQPPIYVLDFEVHSTVVEGVVKYLFVTRTGFRPYAALRGGFIRCVLSSAHDPENPLSLPIIETVDEGPRIVVELGSDYIIAEHMPLIVGGFVRLEAYPTAGADLLPSTLFAFGVRLGVWI